MPTPTKLANSTMSTTSSLTLTLPDEAATGSFGRLLGARLPVPLVIGLSGELGAGKTTLSQGIGAGFGIDGPMPSPSFTLINEYVGTRGRLYHLDLYRLNDLDELLDLGLDDLLDRPDALLLVEWIDRFAVWPEGPERLDIHLNHQPCGRQLELQLPPACRKLEAQLRAWTP
ncbi:MAG: tRNA (adenosine(37)-N6)-threonylcarbamoyltransferase complex ATPase subunit type 1 TsaE [Candidatus Sericytochromatia bacterium]